MLTGGWVVEVNEGKVEATGRGVDWWTDYRLMYRNTSRIVETVPPSIIGGLAEVACDSRADAEHLATHMVEFGGLPATAVRVKRSAGDLS